MRFRQRGKGLVKELLRLAEADLGERVRGRARRLAAFNGGSPRVGAAGPQRQAVRHPVQPASHGIAFTQRFCLARQQQEGRLQHVFGIAGTGEQTAARPPDHRPMPAQQGGEGLAVPVAAEAAQQVAVGCIVCGRQVTDVLQQQRGWRHRRSPSPGRMSFP